MSYFVQTFGKSICTIEMMDTPPTAGQNHILKMAWTGRPLKKLPAGYVPWLNSAHKTMVDHWQQPLTYVFQLPANQFEAWLYEPGESPRKVPVPKR